MSQPADTTGAAKEGTYGVCRDCGEKYSDWAIHRRDAHQGIDVPLRCPKCGRVEDEEGYIAHPCPPHGLASKRPLSSYGVSMDDALNSPDPEEESEEKV